jgi:phospholipid/cholesterol/gamma-HCH transport system permease protein
MAREAGPVFTAVTMAGVMGAGFAAEIGTMAVTEQIDALRVLATDPVRYLVIPRFIAGMCMLPILTVFANFMGLAGGFLVGETFGVPSSMYLASVLRFLTVHDYLGGIVKSAIFGGVIALVGSQRGLGTQGGAAGVGVAATSAAVVAIVVILVMNFFLDLVVF